MFFPFSSVQISPTLKVSAVAFKNFDWILCSLCVLKPLYCGLHTDSWDLKPPKSMLQVSQWEMWHCLQECSRYFIEQLLFQSGFLSSTNKLKITFFSERCLRTRRAQPWLRSVLMWTLMCLGYLSNLGAFESNFLNVKKLLPKFATQEPRNEGTQLAATDW